MSQTSDEAKHSPCVRQEQGVAVKAPAPWQPISEAARRVVQRLGRIPASGAERGHD
jgi:hypothetical protein